MKVITSYTVKFLRAQAWKLSLRNSFKNFQRGHPVDEYSSYLSKEGKGEYIANDQGPPSS